jgi:hypothetical protein
MMAFISDWAWTMETPGFKRNDRQVMPAATREIISVESERHK